MITTQFTIFGEKEISAELNEIVIDSAESLEDYFTATCGESEEVKAWNKANDAYRSHFSAYQQACKDHLNGIISSEEYLAIRATHEALLNAVDAAEALL